MIKKILKDTIGVSVGSVGISEANKIDSPLSGALGTSIGAGLIKETSKNKKGGLLKW